MLKQLMKPDNNEEIAIIDVAKKLLGINLRDVTISVKEAPSGCVQRRCPSTTKLNELTGYEPRVSLDEGLRTINDWYMSDFSRREKS